MIYIDFCKGPKKGLWIGCAEYNNGKYFATGRTLDVMVTNIKTGGARVFHVSARQFVLSSKQMEPGEFESKYIKFASNIFKGRFWYNHEIPKPKEETIKKEPEIKEKEVEQMAQIPSVQEFKQDKKYLYEIKDGVLYVYEKKLIAKYEVEDAK